MIYSKDDVTRMLDTLLKRIYLLVKEGNFAADEFDDIVREIDQLKKEL